MVSTVYFEGARESTDELFDDKISLKIINSPMIDSDEDIF